MDIHTPAQWMLLFYCYCFWGWCFESAYVSGLAHHFINRGFVRGPLLPLYGSGAMLILWISAPLKNNLLSIFILSMLVATLLEYITGFIMELIFQVKYWDYHEHRFQFQGRICLQSSLAWGALSLLLTQVIHPHIAPQIFSIPYPTTTFLALLFSILFAIDLGYSVHTALDFKHLLEDLSTLKKQTNELCEQLSETAAQARKRLNDATFQITDTAADARLRLSVTAAETQLKMELAAQETRLKINRVTSDAQTKIRATLALENVADSIQKRLEQLQTALKRNRISYETKLKKISLSHRWLLLGNPSAVSRKFGEALKELKQRLDRK